jgi:hypothetical protein
MDAGDLASWMELERNLSSSGARASVALSKGKLSEAGSVGSTSLPAARNDLEIFCCFGPFDDLDGDLRRAAWSMSLVRSYVPSANWYLSQGQRLRTALGSLGASAVGDIGGRQIDHE